jgi:hypothetical protein
MKSLVKTKKRHYLVVAREPSVVKNGLDVGSTHLDFHGKTAKVITDPGIADAVEQQYGLNAKGSADRSRVWTHPDEMADNSINYHSMDGIHHFFFGPTKEFSEGWERIFGEKKEVPEEELEEEEIEKVQSWLG